QGGVGGVINAGAMLSDATVSGGTHATVAGRILSSAGLSLQATGGNTATADTLPVVLTILGGAGANANATIDSNARVESLVGRGAGRAPCGWGGARARGGSGTPQTPPRPRPTAAAAAASPSGPCCRPPRTAAAPSPRWTAHFATPAPSPSGRTGPTRRPRPRR